MNNIVNKRSSIHHHSGSSVRFISALLALVLFAALPSLFLFGCKKDGPGGKPADVDYYTCTMHPSVKSQEPKAKCPICSMDLVPVFKKSAVPAPAPQAGHPAHTHPPGLEQPGEFTVPVERRQQIGVTYAAVANHPFAATVRAAGTVAYDQQRHWDYVARVDGYVRKLFVFSRGEWVEKDAPVLTLYSPDLLTTQNEFLDLLKTRDQLPPKNAAAGQDSTDRLVESTKQRLRLWNISDDQIAELEKTRQPQEFVTLKSPFKGVVQDLGVDQGRHVSIGDHLVDIADLSVVWVWAQFYENEISLLKPGLPVTITTAADPGTPFQGKISVIDPFLNEASRTARVRVEVENSSFKLRPGMYVNVELKLDLGQGLGLPASAVLPTGQRNIVFVDKGEGKLEPRFVELGRQYGQLYELKSGLKEGERVVTSANFLIDAEAKVQGALRGW